MPASSSCTGFQWMSGRPRLRLEKSHFFSFHRFSIHRFYISRTFTPSDPPFALSPSRPLFSFFFISFSIVFDRDCALASINKTQRGSRKYLRREAEKSKRKTPPQRGGSYVSVFRYLSSGRRQESDLEPG